MKKKKICLNIISLIISLAALTGFNLKCVAAGEKVDVSKIDTVSASKPIPGLRTIKNFLNNALQPVGSTLYVWGGGWEENSDGSAGSTRIGVNPEWKKFYDSQESKYDWHDTKYKVNLGLDCSGYVGWAVYNTINSKSNVLPGYTTFSTEMAIKLSKQFHFGKFIPSEKVIDYKAGDIMSGNGPRHVWICIGQCSDKSVVFLHSSYQGVHICGTQTPSGNNDSQAYKLAKKYMEKYFSDYSSKFPVFKEHPLDESSPAHIQFIRDTDYLTKYHQMRWTALKDPDGYLNKGPEEILKDLFGEKS